MATPIVFNNISGPHTIEIEFSQAVVCGSLETIGTLRAATMHLSFSVGSLTSTLAISGKVKGDDMDIVVGSLSTNASISGGILNLTEISVSDGFSAYDILSCGWVKTVSESLSSGEELRLQLLISADEYLFGDEALSTNWSGSASVNDSLITNDLSLIIKLLSASIDEELTSTDSTVAQLMVTIREYVTARESLIGVATYNPAISESLSAADSSVACFLLSISEGLAGTDTATGVKQFLAIISESATVSEVLSAVGIYQQLITEVLSAADAIKFAMVLTLDESLSIMDTLFGVRLLSAILEESFIGTDIALGSRKSYLIASDSFTSTDNLFAQAAYGVTVSEILSINVSVIIDGEIYECFALNTSAFHPSVYSNFDFNSFCVYGSRAFGANDEGVFELTGDTDNGEDIHTGVILHDTDFGMMVSKKIRKAYVGVSGDNAVMVMESANGEKRVYEINDKGIANASSAVRGRTWRLSVADFEELESIKLIPVILARGNG